MLPGRFLQFQLKSGAIGPKDAGGDVLKDDGTVKDMVAEGQVGGAHYVMLCAQPYNLKQVRARKTSIMEALSGAGLAPNEDRVHFWDAETVALWVNQHSAVAIWLKELAEPGSVGPFSSWAHWYERSEHAQSPWIEDERLLPLRAQLLERIKRPGGILRVLGNAGIGKSRLVLEAFKESTFSPLPLSDLVLYADCREGSPASIYDVLRNLIQVDTRAIIVVDGCPADEHLRLARMVSKAGSRLSLVTIDSAEDISPGDGADRFVVRYAPQSVTDGILDRDLPGIPSEDRQRLLLFARGFPGIAISVALAWARSTPVAHATEASFVDAFISGTTAPEPELLRGSMLLAAFGLVREDASNSQIDEVASRGEITSGELRGVIARLLRRGVLRRRGGILAVEPRPIAMNLAERQWLAWGPETWCEVLGGDGDPELKVNAARQLRWLNTTDVARTVVAHVCQPGGPYDGQSGLLRAGHTAVFYHLADVDALACAERIQRSLAAVEDLRDVTDEVRRNLVDALARISFSPGAFDEGADLLLRLAVAENEAGITNNATGQFAALFPVILGETAAPGPSRLALLREAAQTTDQRQRGVVIRALIEGIRTSHFSRFLGAESHGARPAMDSWYPMNRDAAEYVAACAKHLADQAKTDDPNGAAARVGLASGLRGLVDFGLIEVVEEVVRRVTAVIGPWPAAIDNLGGFVRFGASNANDAAVERVEALVREIEPKDLAGRTKYLVTDMPWDYPCGEDLDPDVGRHRQLSDVQTVAAELAEHPAILKDVLPGITRGWQRWASAFGQHLAAIIDSPTEWLERIATVVADAPEAERDFDLLAGFTTGLAADTPSAIAPFKQRLAVSPDLAPGLPVVCRSLGLVGADIDLAVNAIDAGLLPPLGLSHWASGGALSTLRPSEVAPLFDTLLEHGPEGIGVALDLMSMYAFRKQTRLDGLRPQIRRVAELAFRGRVPHNVSVVHSFTTIIKWMLKRGPGDRDARFVARTLAHDLATGSLRDAFRAREMVGSVLPVLLSDFSEVVWPLIGQAAITDSTKEWRLSYLLRQPLSVGPDEESPALLSLPQATLFAWCEAHPDVAPALTAGSIPFLARLSDDAAEERPLHPVFRRLLDEFGHREGVLVAAVANIRTGGHWGSLADYLAQYKPALSSLCEHDRPEVARWARRLLGHLAKRIAEARDQDDEHAAQWEV